MLRRWRKAEPADPSAKVGFIGRATPGATDRLTSLGATVYVVADAKVLYVQVFKAACSSMLWAMAQMAGAKPEDLALSRQLHVTRDLTIHDTSIHPVPTIDQVSDELRLEALTSPEWMRLAIVRDPYSRFYSGWESRKLLLHHGPWDDYPQPELTYVDGHLDVGASFRGFARAAREHRGIWQGDFHFAQQVHVMALDEVDFTDIIPTSGLPALFERLSERSGFHVDPGRHNEGLGLAWEDVYDEEAAITCEELFDLDFSKLGFVRRSFDGPKPVVLDDVATAALSMIDERNKRIADMIDAISRVETGGAV